MGSSCTNQNKDSRVAQQSQTLRDDKKIQQGLSTHPTKKQSFHQIMLTPQQPSRTNHKIKPQQYQLLLESFYQSSLSPSKYKDKQLIKQVGHQSALKIDLQPIQPTLKNKVKSILKKSQNFIFSSKILIHEQLPNEYLHQQLKEQKQTRLKITKWQDFKITHLISKDVFEQVFIGELSHGPLGIFTSKHVIKKFKKVNIIPERVDANIKVEQRMKKEKKQTKVWIIRLKYIFQEDFYSYMVMELAKGGNVATFLKQSSSRFNIFKERGEVAIRFILGCTILALQYIHQDKMFYHQLKPKNLLLDSSGYIRLNHFEITKKNYLKLDNLCYHAPQILYGLDAGREVDLWALGILAFQLSNYALPFGLDDFTDGQKYLSALQQLESKKDIFLRFVRKDLKNLIVSLLRLQPKQRLGSSDWGEVKAHPFFEKAQFDWVRLQSNKTVSPLLEILSEQMIYELIRTKKVRKQSSNLYTIEEIYENTVQGHNSCHTQSHL